MNPAAKLDGRTIDAGWCMERIDQVDAGFFHGNMTEASFDRFFAACMKSIDERGAAEQVAQLHEVRDPVLMNAAWRARMAKGLKAREAKLRATCPAYVMVTGSLFVRMALKTMFWVAPPPHPHAVVATVTEGCEFIARRLPGLDPVELERKHGRLRTAALVASGSAPQG